MMMKTNMMKMINPKKTTTKTILTKMVTSKMKMTKTIQLNPALTDFRGPTIFFSVIGELLFLLTKKVKEINMKGP